MTPHDAEADARVYHGLGQAIRSVAPADLSDSGKPHGARVAAGITVYRNNVRAAYLRVLQDTFPVIHRLVGEEFFRYLAHEYFHTHSPSGPLVARYGDKLPEFLRSFEPAAGLPYLPDVARLELAWLGSYHAAEADCMELERFFALLREDPETNALQLHPSVRLVKSPFPIHTIWLHNKSGSADKLRLPEAGECVVVKRPAHRVFTEIISETVWAVLIALQQGKTFSAAITTAIEDNDEAATADIIRKIATMNVITAVLHTD